MNDRAEQRFRQLEIKVICTCHGCYFAGPYLTSDVPCLLNIWSGLMIRPCTVHKPAKLQDEPRHLHCLCIILPLSTRGCRKVLPDVQVGQLRAERARYERALRREVGEDVPLQKVLDEASDWRGRAQHITLLQERLLSLQESQACPSCNES